MPNLPVSIQGDANSSLRGIAALIGSMAQFVQPLLMPRICRVINSTRGYEEVVFVNAVPKVRKRAPGAVGGSRVSIKQTITNDTYETEMEINGDDYKDDQVGMYSDLARELATALLLAPDELVTTVLVAGGSALACYDGDNFYGTVHKWPNGEYTTSQVNYQTGTGTSADTIENDFFTALNAMQNWRDDRGRVRIPAMELNGPGCCIVHHAPALNQAMKRVFGETKGGEPYDIISASAPFTSATAPGMRKSLLSGMCEHVSDAYLTGNSWFIHSIKSAGDAAGGVAARPFAFLDREPPRVQVLSEGSEHWVKNRTVLIKGTRRFGLGVLSPERSQQVYNA